MEALVRKSDAKYPRPAGAIMKYGTAGFRDKAAKLTHVMPRSGIAAALCAVAEGNQAVGLMITASHNPAPDNGVKICDSKGAMVKPEIEALAITLVNAEDLWATLSASPLFQPEALSKCTVVLGRDTRESSEPFSEAAAEMIRNLGATVVDLGVVTTPMLHFGVWYNSVFGEIGSTEKYFQYFATKLSECCDGASTPSRLIFDGACGVGAVHAPSFIPAMEKINVKLELINAPADGVLNSQCGSDFVQTSQGPPQNGAEKGVKYCSVDGDADRIVFHFTDSDGVFHLLDGDKIATLFLRVVSHFIAACPNTPGDKPLEMAIVQTAYANGGSTLAMEAMLKEESSITKMSDVSVDLRCSKTGVKNLHHIAEEYAIGIYFEANGHGTVIFDEAKVDAWADARGIRADPNFGKLMAFLKLFNASVGDAFTDMMAVEAGLAILKMSILDWSHLYTELHSSMGKVFLDAAKMSGIIPNKEHERWLEEPKAIQNVIDEQVKKHKNARAFVRPSGTEPCVRLYVEAEDAAAVKEISENITSFLSTF